MVAGRNCPLCGEEGVPAGVKEGVCLRLCCDSLLTWAWASEEVYEAWYRDPEAYHVAEQRRNGQLPFLDRLPDQMLAAHARLSLLRAHYSLGTATRILDIGAGTGAFVEVAQNHYGCPAEGIEPCVHLVEAARERSVPIRPGDWRSAIGSYSIITMFDVLEHLTRPFECLCHLRQCIEPGGVLAVEMPEWDSPDQRQHGLGWKHIRPRQHLWLPSRKAAEVLFERSGYHLTAFYRPLRGSLGKASWFLAPF